MNWDHARLDAVLKKLETATAGWRARIDAEFDESKHPRESDGRFGSGGGVTSASRDTEDKAMKLVGRKHVEQELFDKFHSHYKGEKLTPVEFTVLREYLDGSYGQLNHTLRNFSKTPKGYEKTLQTRAVAADEIISHALEKLPKVKGTVARKIFLEKDDLGKFLDSYKVGATVEEKSPLSTTSGSLSNIKNIGGTLSDSNIIFSIKSKSGRDVDQKFLVPQKDEHEVLFPSKTKFKVSKVVKTEDERPSKGWSRSYPARYEIEMEEV